MAAAKRKRVRRKTPSPTGRKFNHLAGTIAHKIKAQIKPPRENVWIADEPGESAITIMDLNRLNERCRWPVGEDTGIHQRFCGCQVEDDEQPYCETHRKRAYKAPDKKSEGRSGAAVANRPPPRRRSAVARRDKPESRDTTGLFDR